MSALQWWPRKKMRTQTHQWNHMNSWSSVRSTNNLQKTWFDIFISISTCLWFVDAASRVTETHKRLESHWKCPWPRIRNWPHTSAEAGYKFIVPIITSNSKERYRVCSYGAIQNISNASHKTLEDTSYTSRSKTQCWLGGVKSTNVEFSRRVGHWWELFRVWTVCFERRTASKNPEKWWQRETRTFPFGAKGLFSGANSLPGTFREVIQMLSIGKVDQVQMNWGVKAQMQNAPLKVCNPFPAWLSSSCVAI